MHLAIPQFIQFIGHSREDSLTLCLGAIAPVPVVFAKLFQLVVQASHWCIELPSVIVW